MHASLRSCATFALGALPLVTAASASPQAAWVDWTTASPLTTGPGTAGGVLAGISVTYSGNLYPWAVLTSTSSYWTSHGSTYTSPLVSNPPTTPDILRITGGPNTIEQVFTFSAPVRDPVLAILSLGRPTIAAHYDFDRPFVIEKVGPGYFGNGPLVALPGDVLEGREGNGLIRFPGVHTELRFFAPIAESWSGFTVGLAGTVGTRSCSSANPNSTGAVGRIDASGSAVFAVNELRLAAAYLPLNTFGYFLCSRTPAVVPHAGGSQGTLCLGGNIGRYNQAIVNSGPFGNLGIALDLTSMPSPTGFGTAAAGETWHFQCWYRDSVAGATTSNFTDTVAVDLQ
jgi:hypothetical protein